MLVFRIVLFLVLGRFAVNGITKLAKYDRAEICDTSEIPPIEVKNLRIKHGEGVSDGLFATLVVPVDMREFKVIISFVRCLNREALDTCIPFTTLKPINTCMLLQMQHPAWSRMIDSFKPPLTCPLKQGVYTMTDFHSDISKFDLFPVEGFYWRVNYTIYYLDAYVTLCADCQVVKLVN